MELNKEEKVVENTSFEWVKSNKQKVIDSFADITELPEDILPTTIFMAGSPGAGKTEVSRRLADEFEQKPVIIDADEIRKIIDGYDGTKAYIFQKAANKGVNILYDYSCRKNLNIIMDGTFAYAGALENIQHSLDKNRNVQIFYIYQDPILSWDFTKQRELKEHRNVPREIFINTFVKSFKNCDLAKETFGDKISLNLIVKNFDKGLDKLELNVEKVEHYLPKVYTANDLEEIIK